MPNLKGLALVSFFLLAMSEARASGPVHMSGHVFLQGIDTPFELSAIPVAVGVPYMNVKVKLGSLSFSGSSFLESGLNLHQQEFELTVVLDANQMSSVRNQNYSTSKYDNREEIRCSSSNNAFVVLENHAKTGAYTSVFTLGNCLTLSEARVGQFTSAR